MNNKRWFTFERNGIEFEFDTKFQAHAAINHGGYVLKDCYSSWSESKQAVYDFWKDYCKKVEGKNFRIPSHNSQQLTIAFQFRNIDGKMFQAYITKAHNYLWEIIE